MDPQKILREAIRALARGTDRESVNRRVREGTNGQYQTVADLANDLGVDTTGDASEWVPPPPAEPPPPSPQEQEALQRLAQRPGNGFSDFLRMQAQGMSLGFGDEIAGAAAAVVPGGQGYAEARDASRQRVEDLRLLNPGASFASEFAGDVLIPGGAGRKIAQRVTAKTGSRLGGALAGGGLAGLGGGATIGAGEAEGGLAERVQGALLPALAGGTVGLGAGGLGFLGLRGLESLRNIPGRSPRATGAAGTQARANLVRALREAEVPPGEIPARLQELGPDAVVADLGVNLAREARGAANQSSTLARPRGPLARLAARAEGRGDRIADDLVESSGFQRTFGESLDAAEEARRAVSTDYYRPLEEAFPEVDSRAVRGALDRTDVQRMAGDVIPGPVASGERAPTFRELQDILGKLADERSASRVAGRPNRVQLAHEAWEALERAMKKDIPGFEDAQQAWMLASRRLEAHEMGRKAAYKAPEDIVREMQSLPEEARDAYRRGILDRYETQLRERTTGGGRATALMNAGETMKQRLRVIAENDEKFNDLLQNLDREGVYSMTWSQLVGNSTTAQQTSDMLSQFIQQVPTSKGAVLRKLLSTLTGLTASERRKAAEILGEALMGQGEEAAELLARQINMLGTLSGAAGGAVGAAAGQGVAQ